MLQAGSQLVKKELKKKKLCFKSRSKIFLAFYYWGKFLGVNPLSLSTKNKLQYSYISLFYGCLLSIMYCYVCYCSLVERLRILLPGETPIAIIVDVLGIIFQLLETSSTWLVFAIHQNRMKTIVKNFVSAEKTSKKLGITDDYDKQFKKFGVHLILNNTLFLISRMASNMIWNFFTNFDLSIWSRFNIPAIASFNAWIIFIWCLILVRRKFRRLNETIQFLMQNEYAKANEDDKGSSALIRSSRCDSNILLDRIKMVSQLHRQLRQIINRLEEHFASFVLFSTVNSFIYITLNCYGVYRYMKGHPRQVTDLIYLGAISHWLILPVILLVVTSNVCGSTSDEANNTGNVLHKLLNRYNNYRDNREAANFNLLSLDLLENQVSISVFGLFKLDHFLFYQTLTTATTYLTIMLQLYN